MKKATAKAVVFFVRKYLLYFRCQISAVVLCDDVGWMRRNRLWRCLRASSWPGGAVLVVLESLILGLYIGLEVKEGHEPVFIQKFVIKAGQVLLRANCQHFLAYQEVHSCFQLRISLVEVFGNVTGFCIVLDDFLTGFAKM